MSFKLLSDVFSPSSFCFHIFQLQVEDSHGNVGPGEREFLISPALGSVTMTALGYTQPSDSRFVTTKKPFDWMLDDAYHHLQILATHYEWFQEMFDRYGFCS